MRGWEYIYRIGPLNRIHTAMRAFSHVMVRLYTTVRLTGLSILTCELIYTEMLFIYFNT